MMLWVRFIAGCLLLATGLFFAVSAVIGNYRFAYVLSRMHAAALADTCGLLFTGLGLVCFLGFSFTALKVMLVVALFWMASPAASHLLAQMQITGGEAFEEEPDLAALEDEDEEDEDENS